MKWKKLGLIFDPKRYDSPEWMASHAMMPCVDHIGGDDFRIYFSPRDGMNRSRPASLDININSPLKYSNLSPRPLLELGQLGGYDDSGVMPTCIYSNENVSYMLFNGWTLGKNIPFFSFNGLANNINGQFAKIENYPNALNRSSSDPYSTFAPFVLKDGSEWHMWYVSLIKWDESLKHYYHIKYASSVDGVNWTPEDIVCIDFISKDEYAIARPVVIKENGIFKMWFSSRSLNGDDTYRIRYAESDDGLVWNRIGDSNIQLSEDGWDSQMICYGYVFSHKGSHYMIYNGNNYGETGFGIAILVDE
ncbi:hypothetical protein [Vibrio genomosp. F6]|uniref:Glycosyl hydrolase family 32 N-terminal domain-containing protein n=1 Tax=Vibrio genomosp. F6 str. FF-238 TaxID=1191298 RepID=A0A1E5D2H2_9VIBR|nr:hypothetical protein [Vibrio genomosp. F6]OEE77718.1 hypothetical protein A130_14400 [Vibrio genomosp. F6 str. FF-238]